MKEAKIQEAELKAKLANDYNLWIIEDACHAPGGYFINSENNFQKCGNGHYADLSIFSFITYAFEQCFEQYGFPSTFSSPQ